MKIKPLHIALGTVAAIAIAAAASGGKKKKVDLENVSQRLAGEAPRTPPSPADAAAVIDKLSSPFKAIGRAFERWLARGDEKQLAEWYEWKYGELFSQFEADIEGFVGKRGKV